MGAPFDTSNAVPPLSIIELDQDDIFARLQADPFFQAGVPVLEQRKGITESDIQVALGTVNQANGRVGSVAIVLMPRMRGQDPNAPGPRYTVRYPIQVIDYPVLRRQAATGTPAVGGTQQSAEEICDRIRQIIHLFNMGRGQTIAFDSLEPSAEPAGMVGYVLSFKRLGIDFPPVGCAAVGISPNSGGVNPTLPGPQTVTLSCATAGAAIYYTIDGSYPSSLNPTAVLYSAPFSVPSGTTLRAAAELTGNQQSQVISQAVYS
jgi:hypothetical protein